MNTSGLKLTITFTNRGVINDQFLQYSWTWMIRLLRGMFEYMKDLMPGCNVSREYVRRDALSPNCTHLKELAS